MVVNYRKVIAPIYYTCAVSVSIPEIGTVTGGGKYLKDATVTISAVPGERATFVGWVDENGDVVSENPTYTFTITEDVSLTALFVRLWTVATSVSPENSGLAAGDGIYQDGQEVVLSASSGEGYIFTGWKDSTGTLVSTEQDYSFIIHSDHIFTAYFAALCTVTTFISLEGAGGVTGAGEYAYGSQVTVVASVNVGFVFSGWRGADGNVLSQELTYTFIITSDIVLTAGFMVEPRLPSGYTEVEYIEQISGNASIDTGVKPTKYNKILIDVEPLEVPTRNQYIFSSALAMSGASQYSRCYWGSEGVVAYSGNMGYGTTNYLKILSSNTTPRRMKISIDNITVTASLDNDVYPLTNNNFTTQAKTYSLLDYGEFHGRIYSCKIETENSILRDFVPCVGPEGIVGLYEMVNNKFYGSAGTGVLIAGPEI